MQVSSINISMEFCENGNLENLIYEKMQKAERLSEQEILKYISQILLGINYLHERNVVHGDLKLENLFLDGKHSVKIGDFGVCK